MASLEEVIAKLTAAVEKNNALLAGGKALAAPAATSGKTETKAAPAAEEKRGPGRPKKDKGPTLEVVTEKANAYMEQEGKPAARALLKKHGSPDGKLAGVPKENYAALVEEIDRALTEAEDDEDGDDEDDDSI